MKSRFGRPDDKKDFADAIFTRGHFSTTVYNREQVQTGANGTARNEKTPGNTGLTTARKFFETGPIGHSGTSPKAHGGCSPTTSSEI
jgi:hypothetical protein